MVLMRCNGGDYSKLSLLLTGDASATLIILDMLGRVRAGWFQPVC